MKLIFKISLALSLMFSLLYPLVDVLLYAETLEDLYSGLEELKQEKSTNDSSTKAAQDQIKSNEAAIQTAVSDVFAKQNEIAINETEIAKLEVDVETKKIEISELMVFYQTSQSDNLELSVLTNTDSIVDAIHLESSVELLTEKSDSKIDELMVLQEDLRAKNVVLNENIVELESLQVALTQEIASLNVDIRFLQDERVDIDDQIADQEKLIAYYEDLGCGSDENLEACKTRNTETTPIASGFISPLEDGMITSFSGWYNPFGIPLFHTGTDMVGGSSNSIYASAPGTVAMVGSDGSRGNYAYIHHIVNGQRYTTAYFHMLSPSSLYIGQQVTAEDYVGTIGNTGFSTGPHLHFEILQGFIGQDFYSSSQAYLDVRNFINYPGTYVYWSGRNR